MKLYLLHPFGKAQKFYSVWSIKFTFEKLFTVNKTNVKGCFSKISKEKEEIFRVYFKNFKNKRREKMSNQNINVDFIEIVAIKSLQIDIEH